MAAQTKTRKPPVSRAKPVPGRHRTPQPRPAGPGAHRGQPSRGERQAVAQQQREQREAKARRSKRAGQAKSAVIAPVTAGDQAGKLTKGGQHALMAEFLLFVGIVGLRAVADYVPGNQGQATEGTTKGAITPRNDQLGPLPILAAGMVVFFVLSFLAARGGAWAKVAAVSGLIIDTALLMKSLPELGTVSGAFGNVTSHSSSSSEQVPPTYVQPVGYQGTSTPSTFVPVPDATGIFPVITSNVPPAAPGAGQNPGVFTQPQTGA